MYKAKFILYIIVFVLMSGSNCFSDIPKEFKFVKRQTRILRYNTEVISTKFQRSDLLQYEPFIFTKTSSRTSTPLLRTRIMIAPVISFYGINKNHSSNVTQKMSGLFSLKEEIRLNQNHNMFLELGVEYMVHGLNFNSYYFKPDSIQLYTGKMNYAYSLYVHEIDFPIQIKLCFNHENNARITPYCMIGYHFRTLLDAQLKVKQDGETVQKTYEVLTFKNPLISRRNNPFLSLTLGIQKNNLKTFKNCIFMEVTYRYGFSPYLLKDTFTPSSLYITGNHLTIGFGFKF